MKKELHEKVIIIRTNQATNIFTIIILRVLAYWKLSRVFPKVFSPILPLMLKLIRQKGWSVKPEDCI